MYTHAKKKKKKEKKDHMYTKDHVVPVRVRWIMKKQQQKEQKKNKSIY